MPIPKEVKTVQEVVRWLAEKHDLSIFAMAEKVGISSAGLEKWEQGDVKRPSEEMLVKLWQTFPNDFDIEELISLVQRQVMERALHLAGAGRKRPRQNRHRKAPSRRSLMSLLAGLALLFGLPAGGVQAHAGTPGLDSVMAELPLIGDWRRRLSFALP